MPRIQTSSPQSEMYLSNQATPKMQCTHSCSSIPGHAYQKQDNPEENTAAPVARGLLSRTTLRPVVRQPGNRFRPLQPAQVIDLAQPPKPGTSHLRISDIAGMRLVHQVL